MSLYGRRLAAMARVRRKRGCWGKRNGQPRFLSGGYTFARASSIHVIKALFGWAALELREGWRSWFLSSRTAPRGAGRGEDLTFSGDQAVASPPPVSTPAEPVKA